MDKYDDLVFPFPYPDSQKNRFEGINFQALFEKLGGVFLWPLPKIRDRFLEINHLILDWDGVFSDGRKDQHKNSTYSELDTMGLNMLRFGVWLETGKVLPVFIVTGENNPTAWQVAQRDHFDAAYFSVKNKAEIHLKLEQDFSVKLSRSLFFFDDILDLALARKCAMAIGLQNSSLPLFQILMRAEPTCAYMTANGGNNHGIREACELLLGLLNRYEQVVEHRTEFSPAYRAFLLARNQTQSLLM